MKGLNAALICVNNIPPESLWGSGFSSGAIWSPVLCRFCVAISYLYRCQRKSFRPGTLKRATSSASTTPSPAIGAASLWPSPTSACRAAPPSPAYTPAWRSTSEEAGRAPPSISRRASSPMWRRSCCGRRRRRRTCWTLGWPTPSLTYSGGTRTGHWQD